MMCEKIGENEIFSAMNNKTSSLVSKEIQFCQTYERRMTEYMQSVPHIPPTLFELKLRHNAIKSEVVKQFKNAVNSDNGRHLVSKLENLIEKVYTNLVKKNAKEYKTCQAGFVIGWKCSFNKPQNDIKPVDDRF
ncbi:unnamed protein product [Oppiella nova]|uniref:Uncharacterized protein n=1 Tax=Oppiella nova TaxID=334625 RepID=A0A7R9LUQ8_9ACAR|nr:unnamed protein product [Oppiella nova]CAG2167147.1 unnamed protein product [Oppiella nova]